MKKKAIAATIGATLVGLLIGSTLGLPGGASAKQKNNSVSDGQVMHANGDAGDKMSHSRRNGKDIEELASVLKLTAAELKTQLMSGKTLAEIATAQKVDVDLVVNAIVTKIKTHVAEEVAAGEITQAQADSRLADLSTRVTEMVNNGRPQRGANGMGSHGKNGMGPKHSNHAGFGA